MISRLVVLLLGTSLCSGPLQGLATLSSLAKYAPLMNSSWGSSLLLSGKGVNELGLYDRCLKEGHRYFYLSYLLPDLQAQVGVGVCLPSQVDQPALSSALHSLAAKYLSPAQTQFIQVLDSQNTSIHSSFLFYLFWAVLALLFLLGVAAMANNRSISWLACFHPLDNLKALPQVPVRPPGLCLDFLDGVRVVATLVVILGHTYFLRGVNTPDMQAIQEFTQTLPFSILMGGLFSVDMFFLLSGFLVVQSVGSRKVSLPWAGVFRYLRLMPLYLFLMMGYYQVLPLLGSGPRWPLMLQFTNACDKMWRNFLLIDNWFSMDQTYCFGWGWYISNDFQMFLIALLPLAFWKKRPWLTKVLTLGLITSNIMVQLVSNLTHHSTLYFYGLPNDTTAHSRSIYFRLPYRWGVYFIGALFGLYILQLKDYLVAHSILLSSHNIVGGDQPILLSLQVILRKRRAYRCVCYLLGLAIILTLVTIKDDFVQRKGQWPLGVQQLVNVIERPLFGLGLLCCLLPLFLQTSSIWSAVFSWYPLRLLSKLSYAMYLSHFIVIMYGLYSARQNVFFRHLDLLSFFYADTLVTVLLSLLLHLLVETPFFRLLTHLLRKDTPPSLRLLLDRPPKPNALPLSAQS